MCASISLCALPFFSWPLFVCCLSRCSANVWKKLPAHAIYQHMQVRLRVFQRLNAGRRFGLLIKKPSVFECSFFCQFRISWSATLHVYASSFRLAASIILIWHIGAAHEPLCPWTLFILRLLGCRSFYFAAEIPTRFKYCNIAGALSISTFLLLCKHNHYDKECYRHAQFMCLIRMVFLFYYTCTYNIRKYVGKCVWLISHAQVEMLSEMSFLLKIVQKQQQMANSSH